jgi:hypothetical protein
MISPIEIKAYLVDVHKGQTFYPYLERLHHEMQAVLINSSGIIVEQRREIERLKKLIAEIV